MTQIQKINGEFLVNTTTTGSQDGCSMTVLANGTMVVVWTDSSDAATTNANVVGQLLDRNGRKLGGEFSIATESIGYQGTPSVTALADGGFVVSWADMSGIGGDGQGYAIKAQMFSGLGTKVGGEGLINTETLDEQITPSTAALSNGGMVIAWVDYSKRGGDSSGTAVKAQILDASGGAVTGEFLVNTATQDDQSDVAVAGLANGGFVATWSDKSGAGGDASGWGIKAQIFSETGGKVGTELLVNTVTSSDQLIPAVTVLDNGGFAIAWSDVSGQGGDSSGTSVKAQFFNAQGAKTGGEILVNTTTESYQANPALISVGYGFVAAVWEDYGEPSSSLSSNVHMQLLDSAGNKVGGETLVNTATGSGQFTPVLAALGEGRFAVSWNDSSGTGGDGSDTSVKAQIFTLNEAPTANADAFTMSEDGVLTIKALDLLGNDADAFGDASFAVTAVSGAVNGTVSLDNRGTAATGDDLIRFTAQGDFNGQAGFSYTIRDSHGLADTGAVKISVKPVADAPKLAAPLRDRVFVEDKAIAIAVPGQTFTDADGEALVLSAKLAIGSALPSWLKFSAASKSFAGKPPQDWNGALDIAVTARDASGASASDTFRLSVTAINDAPVITSGKGAPKAAYTVKENTKAVATMLASDVDHKAVTWSLSGKDAELFTIAKTGQLSFRSAPDFEAPKDSGSDNTYSLSVKASDGSLSDSQTLAIKVANIGGKSVIGTGKANKLKGTLEEDTLKGGGGNDRLTGGQGADKLWGGAGKDTFVFTKLADSTLDARGRDTIFDFGKGDRFDLSVLDASTKKAGNQAFSWIGTDTFHGKAGELRFEKKASDTYVYADTNGDKKADFSIHLDDAVKLVKADFLL